MRISGEVYIEITGVYIILLPPPLPAVNGWDLIKSWARSRGEEQANGGSCFRTLKLGWERFFQSNDFGGPATSTIDVCGRLR